MSTWHVQFHGNASCSDDVFLSNGVSNPPAMLQTLATNIETASAAAATAGGEGRVIAGCPARGTDNADAIRLRLAPTPAICREENVPIGPSRFIHVEQRRTVRRASSDSEATPGVNRLKTVSKLRKRRRLQGADCVGPLVDLGTQRGAHDLEVRPSLLVVEFLEPIKSSNQSAGIRLLYSAPAKTCWNGPNRSVMVNAISLNAPPNSVSASAKIPAIVAASRHFRNA